MPAQNEGINYEKHGVGNLWGRDSKTLIKHRAIRYRPRRTGTDTAYCVHGKFVFHNVINTWEFIANYCVTVKDIVDFGCCRFALYGAKDTQEPAANSHVMGTNTANCRCSRFVFHSPISMQGQLVSHELILRAQIADKNE